VLAAAGLVEARTYVLRLPQRRVASAANGAPGLLATAAQAGIRLGPDPGCLQVTAVW
jgi:hypothetical protein